MVLYARIINMILAVGMSVTAVLSYVGASVSTGILATYVLAFSCLLCCFETHLKQIAKTIAENFGFLFHAKSRAIFLIFVGIMLFNLGILGTVCGSAMLANAAFNFYLVVRYPGYEDFQRADAESEIKDYLREHPELGEAAVRTTVNYAKENPDMVRSGVDAYMDNQQQSGYV
jgi:hypothetical protein